MIKKLISVLLAAAMWTVCILPCLTGCNGGGGDGYTVAEWLDKVEMQFNMLYYNTDEPFFPNVTAESQHFDTLQIAAEWGLVDPAAGIRPDDKITKEFAADTLVSAMAFNYEADAGIADADKISDLNKVSIAVNEGVFTLDGNGRFDPQKLNPFNGTSCKNSSSKSSIKPADELIINIEFLNTLAVDFFGFVNLNPLYKRVQKCLREFVNVCILLD